ncbi:MAG: DUF2837 family protein [Bacillota bacterium]|nr:DUF2837 family protein [Bacillota bacterium]
MEAGTSAFSSILLVCLLTAIIHMVETLSYGARIAGIKTRRLYLAASLFSIVVLLARTANLIQAPLLGYYVDSVIILERIPELRESIRMIIFSATIGSLAALMLIPTFVNIFEILIGSLERSRSLGNMFMNIINADKLMRKVYFALAKSVKLPRLSNLLLLKENKIPKEILILYILVASINTVGVLSAIYAGALIPDYRLTASQMSGVLNGFSTIILTFFIDPYASLITDHTLVGKRKLTDLKALITYLVIGKIIGTLLGQLAFIPCARFVVLVTTLLQKL